jgi:hypothetical protein
VIGNLVLSMELVHHVKKQILPYNFFGVLMKIIRKKSNVALHQVPICLLADENSILWKLVTKPYYEF